MNKPIPMRKNMLVAVLRDMAELVEACDSFEGSIQYEMPVDQEVPEGTYALVRASYRIGNSMGQGGLRIIGDIEEEKGGEK